MLRSIDIVPIILPAYYLFFNSIEYMFGYIEKSFQRHYVESKNSDLLPFVVETFERFEKFDMARVYEHCGWMIQDDFDPTGPLLKKNRLVPNCEGFVLNESDGEDGSGF
ncbi:hypothetical protein PHMEG_00024173 [Phytophthora megakarya]|uniref:Uncharacterized protein n=1 Tax=Phytophthora megakarya TaxID=4795 RepID=A0A225VEC7_9STRA|nr:hypothetical protein PHMEG_00024173 [Phytophthora megakarya]